MPIDKRRIAKLAASRPSAIGRLLLRARLDFVARATLLLQRRGVPAYPASFLTLLPHIDTDHTRSTELARRAGISKQAASKTIKELEEAGLLERLPDDQDGRAFLVRLTEQGLELLLETHRAVDQIERDYERLLGKTKMATLRSALQTLAYPDAAEAAPASASATTSASAARAPAATRRRSPGRRDSR
ncbi:MAG: MarR family winged helix-turn-helix transcriptional regulator [Burkholderiaceae bacterium]